MLARAQKALWNTPTLLASSARGMGRRGMASVVTKDEEEPKKKVKTGVVLLNMGGPESSKDVGDFLTALFSDTDIIKLPFQKYLGPLISKRRTPHVTELYDSIGGGSPIHKWTKLQGQGIEKLLDATRPESAPHRCYIGFRYVSPRARSALLQMKEDGVERAVAFSQYPQFSCTTAGSSLNELWREVRALGLEGQFSWSLIDRWPTHPEFIKAVSKKIKEGLELFSPEDRDDVHIVFSAHSLPLRTVFKGDQYSHEVAASVMSVMTNLNFSHRYTLCWQSQVGPSAWLAPKTSDILEALGKKGTKSVLVVPIAFTSDHIETLSEIDNDFREVAIKAGVTNFRRSPSLNDDPAIIQAMSTIVKEHLDSGHVHSRQYGFRCPSCVNPECRNVLNPASSSIGPTIH